MTTLKRSPSRNVNLLRPGEYMSVLNSETWTVYKCPGCGYATSLARVNHRVHYDGVVDLTVTCPHKMPGGERCNFSDLVCLADWVPEAKGSA